MAAELERTLEDVKIREAEIKERRLDMESAQQQAAQAEEEARKERRSFQLRAAQVENFYRETPVGFLAKASLSSGGNPRIQPFFLFVLYTQILDMLMYQFAHALIATYAEYI